jgi:hypothetical protein
MLGSNALKSASRNRRLLCAVNLELLNTTRELHILTSSALVASRNITPHDYVLWMRDTFGARNTAHLAEPEIRVAYRDFFLILDDIERILQAHSFSSVNTHPAVHPLVTRDFIVKTQKQLVLILLLNPAMLVRLIAAAVVSLTKLDDLLVQYNFP